MARLKNKSINDLYRPTMFVPERAVYNREPPDKRGYDSVWRKLRGQFLARHPLCLWCKTKGITTPATMVHHLKPIKKVKELRLDDDNLVSLCRSCHGEIHTLMTYHNSMYNRLADELKSIRNAEDNGG